MIALTLTNEEAERLAHQLLMAAAVHYREKLAELRRNTSDDGDPAVDGLARELMAYERAAYQLMSEIKTRLRVARQADAPPAGGLFDLDARKQLDLVDAIHQSPRR